jgi:hypothetical protein
MSGGVLSGHEIPLNEVYGLWSVTWWETPWALLFFIVLLVIIGIGIYFLYRWYVSAYSRSVRLLKKVATYDMLTDLLKNYLQQREQECGLRSNEHEKITAQTDQELIKYLKKRWGLEDKFVDSLVLIIDHAQTVKFEQARRSTTSLARDKQQVYLILKKMHDLIK